MRKGRAKKKKITLSCSCISGEELARAGGLEKYEPGFTFRDAGGTEAVYNDQVDMWIQREGHDLHITDNVCIRPSEYTLGITGEYKWLLNHLELLFDLWSEYDREKNLTDHKSDDSI